MSNIDRFANSNRYRWDDMAIDINQVKLAGVSDPSPTAYKGGYVLAFDKNSDNIIYFNCQFKHSYAPETNIEFHIHVAYPDSNSGNSIWNFTYSWADIGSDFPSETEVLGVTLASPENQDRHTIHEVVASISGTGKTGVSSILICSLQREGTNGSDSYNNDIYLISADFHYQKDELGSINATSK